MSTSGAGGMLPGFSYTFGILKPFRNDLPVVARSPEGDRDRREERDRRETRILSFEGDRRIERERDRERRGDRRADRDRELREERERRRRGDLERRKARDLEDFPDSLSSDSDSLSSRDRLEPAVRDLERDLEWRRRKSWAFGASGTPATSAIYL